MLSVPVSTPRGPRRADAFARARRLLALEGIGNPDNVGGIVLSPTCADPFYRKAIRTSMGAVLRVPFTVAGRWPDDLRTLRAGGMQAVALTPDPRATPLGDFAATLDAGARLVLMVGAEGPGLTRQALDAADRLVRIPIDSGIDSLNVVVAAGIAAAALPR